MQICTVFENKLAVVWPRAYDHVRANEMAKELAKALGVGLAIWLALVSVLVLLSAWIE